MGQWEKMLPSHYPPPSPSLFFTAAIAANKQQHYQDQGVVSLYQKEGSDMTCHITAQMLQLAVELSSLATRHHWEPA